MPSYICLLGRRDEVNFFVLLDAVEINFSGMPHTSRGKAKRSYSTCEPRPWLAGLSATTATAYDHSAITTGLLEQPRVLLPSIYFRSSLQ